MGLRIRAIDAMDADVVASLLVQLGYPTSVEKVADRISRLMSSRVDNCVVEELDGVVAGMASVHISQTIVDHKPTAKLSALVVDQRLQRRGIGTALVAAMETQARAIGCFLIFLTTADSRGDAHAFYRRLGFQETGRRFAKHLN